MQKCVEYCKKYSQKKLEFFNKAQIKYEFLIVKNIEFHIKFMFCSKILKIFGRGSYNIMYVCGKFY